MKNLKKILMCLVLAVALGLSFTACGKDKTEKPPEEKEVYKTESISYEEFQSTLSGLSVTMPTGFEAEHSTTYADGTTDTAKQVVNIREGEVVSSIEVVGQNKFKGYLADGIVYFENPEKKLFSWQNEARNHPDYQTTLAYNYLIFLINPVDADLADSHIYDGSFFKNLQDVFSANEESFSIKKIYSSKHTNIEIEYSDDFKQAKYTLYFEGTTFTGLDVWTKTLEYERTSKVKSSNTQLQLPSFDDFAAEIPDQNPDDVWNPNS